MSGHRWAICTSSGEAMTWLWTVAAATLRTGPKARGGQQSASSLEERAGGERRGLQRPPGQEGTHARGPHWGRGGWAAGLAEWGQQAVRGPRTVGLSVEVKGLVVLMEGTKCNHVPFSKEPDLRVFRELSSTLWVLTAAN